MKLLPWLISIALALILFWRGCNPAYVEELAATRHEADSLQHVVASVLQHDSGTTAAFMAHVAWSNDTISKLNKKDSIRKSDLHFKDTRISNLIASQLEQARAVGDTAKIRELEGYRDLYQSAKADVVQLLKSCDFKDSLAAVMITDAEKTIDKKDSTIAQLRVGFTALVDVQARTQGIADKLSRQANRKLSVGPYVGYGLTKEGLRPSIGISIQFPIIKF